MRPDEGPCYRGGWVKFDGDGITYTVWIDPALPTGEGSPRHFGSKHEAWGRALALARDLGFPLRDLTDSNASKIIEK